MHGRVENKSHGKTLNYIMLHEISWEKQSCRLVMMESACEATNTHILQHFSHEACETVMPGQKIQHIYRFLWKLRAERTMFFPSLIIICLIKLHLFPGIPWVYRIAPMAHLGFTVAKVRCASNWTQWSRHTWPGQRKTLRCPQTWQWEIPWKSPINGGCNDL